MEQEGMMDRGQVQRSADMFGEQPEEWNPKLAKKVPVYQSPKYREARANAIDILQKFPYLEESDFWILKHETKDGKISYDGLIISHLGCLKINDNMPPEKRFVPSSVTPNNLGYDNTLVFTYKNDEQGIYEVGEVSPRNCKNAYVYAMALKRCFDRVVLKLSKIAFKGILSDSEVEGQTEEHTEENDEEKKALDALQHELSDALNAYCQSQNAVRREIVQKILKARKVRQIGRTIEDCRAEIELLKKWEAGEE